MADIPHLRLLPNLIHKTSFMPTSCVYTDNFKNNISKKNRPISRAECQKVHHSTLKGAPASSDVQCNRMREIWTFQVHNSSVYNPSYCVTMDT